MTGLFFGCIFYKSLNTRINIRDAMEAKKTIGERIQDFIDAHDGETLESFAGKINVRLNTVWRWTAGKSKPSPLAQEKLDKILRGYERKI